MAPPRTAAFLSATNSYSSLLFAFCFSTLNSRLSILLRRLCFSPDPSQRSSLMECGGSTPLCLLPFAFVSRCHPGLVAWFCRVPHPACPDAGRERSLRRVGDFRSSSLLSLSPLAYQLSTLNYSYLSATIGSTRA